MRGCYYLDFAFHSSTQVHRVNEIGRHHLGYVPLFSPQNRRFDRQLDHNIQQEHIYSRVWCRYEWRHLRSSGYVEWSLECNLYHTTVSNYNAIKFYNNKVNWLHGMCQIWLLATLASKYEIIVGPLIQCVQLREVLSGSYPNAPIMYMYFINPVYFIKKYK